MHLNKNKLKVKGTPPPRPKKKKSCLFPTPLQQEGKMVKVSSEKPFTDQKNVHFNFPGFLFIHFFFSILSEKNFFFFSPFGGLIIVSVEGHVKPKRGERITLIQIKFWRRLFSNSKKRKIWRKACSFFCFPKPINGNFKEKRYL